MKLKILPRKDQVLVEVDKEQSRESKHGLSIPSNIEQDKQCKGTVLSVGSEVKDLKKGQRVIFAMLAGETLNFGEDLNKVELKLIPDEDILAILED